MAQNTEQKGEEFKDKKMQQLQDLYEQRFNIFKNGKQNLKDHLMRLQDYQNLQQTLKKIHSNDFHDLPIQIIELVKKNKYLEKENNYLRQQLKQKQVQIGKLKQQVYQAILDEMENKIHCLRLIEEESQLKAKQIIQRKMEKFHLNDGQIFLHLKNQVNNLQKNLRIERKTNEQLAKNVVQLKQYIITAMEEKDMIIHELKIMILNEHHQNQHNFVDDTQKHEHFSENILSNRAKSKQQSYGAKQSNVTKIPNNLQQQTSQHNFSRSIKPKIIKNY